MRRAVPEAAAAKNPSWRGLWRAAMGGQAGDALLKNSRVHARPPSPVSLPPFLPCTIPAMPDAYPIRLFRPDDLARLQEITAETFGPVSIDKNMERLLGPFGQGG